MAVTISPPEKTAPSTGGPKADHCRRPFTAAPQVTVLASVAARRRSPSASLNARDRRASVKNEIAPLLLAYTNTAAMAFCRDPR